MADQAREAFPELSTPHVPATRGDGDVVFELAERPENGRLEFPRLNNVIKTVTVVDQPDAGYLRQTQTPKIWSIHIPSGLSYPAKILMKTHGRPLIATEPHTANPAPNGELVLSAHHATVHGEKLQFEPQPYKNTVGYWVEEDAWAEWRLNVTLPGRYQVRILQGCGQGQGGSQVELRVQDRTVRFEVLETGHFQNFIWRDLGEVELTAGSTTLSLKPTKLAKNAVMDVRQIRLVPLGLEAQKDTQRLADVEPDLALPPVLEQTQPTPGRRVRQTLADYDTDKTSHILYLPTDWQRRRRYSVFVELPGNGGYENQLGDRCTGRVEDAKLGFGISGGHGAIVLTLPFLDADRKTVLTWWGSPPEYSVEHSLKYWRQAIDLVCNEFGGDRDRLVLVGFSRGSIACNYLGLHDKQTAALWNAMICVSHYDGVQENWPYPESDRHAATERLKRLGQTPQFICHEIDQGNLLEGAQRLTNAALPDGRFTFHSTGFPNHSDAWALRPTACRAAIRSWLDDLFTQTAAQ